MGESVIFKNSAQKVRRIYGGILIKRPCSRQSVVSAAADSRYTVVGFYHFARTGNDKQGKCVQNCARRLDKEFFMNLTPKQIVHELNKYIIGQDEAKKAVEIALRNGYLSLRPYRKR